MSEFGATISSLISDMVLKISVLWLLNYGRRQKLVHKVYKGALT